jgi:hypothetical protein
MRALRNMLRLSVRSAAAAALIGLLFVAVQTKMMGAGKYHAAKRDSEMEMKISAHTPAGSQLRHCGVTEVLPASFCWLL